MTAARRLAAILAADVAVPTTDPLAGARGDQAKKETRNFLRESKIGVIPLPFVGLNLRSISRAARKERRESGIVASETQCDTGKKNPIWIRCNPLKSPDSDE